MDARVSKIVSVGSFMAQIHVVISWRVSPKLTIGVCATDVMRKSDNIRSHLRDPVTT